jgi:glycolate oxidase FAD binding subunit
MNNYTPAGIHDLAAAVAAANEEGRPVTPWGAGAHRHIGNLPPEGALALHTGALNRVLDYIPADLTITIEAGATLAQVQALLAPHRQWLPWDPPGGATATIGGLLAAGVAGSLRLGYGSPRDWLLGVRVVLGDGRVVRSGGKVVKNVAGYDLHKLHIGALGTLGVIAEVTFKIAPIPDEMASALLPCAGISEALVAAERLRAAPMAPVSLAVFDAAVARSIGLSADAPAYAAVRYAGAPAAVNRQIGAAQAIDGAMLRLDAAPGATLWDGIARFAEPSARRDPALILRAGAAPAQIAPLAAAIVHHAATPPALLAYPGVGLVYTHWHGDDAALAALRAAVAPLGGYAVVEYAPEGAALDRWGPPPPSIDLMRELRARWDPNGILNRGRYLV